MSGSNGDRSQTTVRTLPLPNADGQHLHRAILGMIDLLPRVGEDYPLNRRVVWLRTMAGLFDLIYGFDGASEIRIEAQDGK